MMMGQVTGAAEQLGSLGESRLSDMGSSFFDPFCISQSSGVVDEQFFSGHTAALTTVVSERLCFPSFVLAAPLCPSGFNIGLLILSGVCRDRCQRQAAKGFVPQEETVFGRSEPSWNVGEECLAACSR